MDPPRRLSKPQAKKARSRPGLATLRSGGRGRRGHAMTYQRMPSNGLKLVLPFTLSR
ncbi:hypothetical protein FHY33_004267 [Xanthomonas arboricola]|nr:hypothetical protein [Xanthomonas campestris]